MLKNEWDNTKIAERTQKGLFSNGGDLKYICLGGNQAWNWGDNDAPFDFAKLFIKNGALSQGEIKSLMQADFGDINVDEYLSGETGISAITAVQQANDTMYNLSGQKVDKSYKGIVILNGKKMVNK